MTLSDQDLNAKGYRTAKRFGNGTVAGIQPRLFGAAVICWPLTVSGHDYEWMYEKASEASDALAVWNGRGEPQGWRRFVGPGFEVKTVLGSLSIRCKSCGAISFNAGDISQRYCGRCHRFHEEDV